jgi:exopolyphosphatase / guanosine-5'-triphosphate,3'-diphosphate pyrophosphatase
VRLTEKFVADTAQPFDPALSAAIAAHVRRELSRAALSIASPAAVVGTGGTLATLRKVLAARADAVMEQTDARITLAQLRDTLVRLGGLALPERKKVPGLPPERADVFPTALATLVALAEIGGFDAYQHSLYNLRWGVAAEALERKS